MAILAAPTCQRCRAALGVMDGVVCPGCGELLCSRHFGAARWLGVLASASSETLCDRCVRPVARRGPPLPKWPTG